MESLRELCVETSMHGLKYIVEDGRKLIERVSWVILFSGALSCSLYQIFNIVYAFQTSPVTTSIDPEAVPIYDLTFPVITICNVGKQPENYFKASIANTSLDAKEHQAARRGFTNLYYSILHEAPNEQAEQLAEYLKINFGLSTTDDFFCLTEKLSQPCSDMIRYCEWQGKPVPCNQIVFPRFTDEGLCCTVDPHGKPESFCPYYNMTVAELLSKSETNRTDARKKEDTSKKASPLSRNVLPGQSKGVTLVLNTRSKEWYKIRSSKFIGFKMLVHDQSDFPKVGELGLAVDEGRHTQAAITVTKINSSSDVRLLEPSKRGCRFQDEASILTYYDEYNFANCENDCKIQIYLKNYDCVIYYLASYARKKDPTIRICNITDYFRFGEGLDFSACTNCSPSCENTILHSTVTSAPLSANRFTKYARSQKIDMNNFTTDNAAVLDVYFRQQKIVRYKRDLSYTWEDLLSNIGGILSLGFGFSLISAVEVVYFLSPCRLFRKNK